MKLKGKASNFLLLVLGLVLLGAGLFIEQTGKHEEVQGVQTETGLSDQVKEVLDGDTFTLINGEKVRLIGINAPESGQPYADKAKTYLESLLATPVVKLTTDTQEQDQYGRILAYAYTAEDRDINLQMVEEGYAVVETVPPNVSKADIFTQAQELARINCRGIWEGLCSPSDSSCIQISEINQKARDNDKNTEWIEFSNTCAMTQSLNGYLLKDSSASNSYTFGNIALGSKKTVKLYTGCGVDSEASLYWQCPERSNFIWNDDHDRAYLYSSEGKLISELGY